MITETMGVLPFVADTIDCVEGETAISYYGSFPSARVREFWLVVDLDTGQAWYQGWFKGFLLSPEPQNELFYERSAEGRWRRRINPPIDPAWSLADYRRESRAYRVAHKKMHDVLERLRLRKWKSLDFFSWREDGGGVCNQYLLDNGFLHTVWIRAHARPSPTTFPKAAPRCFTPRCFPAFLSAMLRKAA